MKIKLSFIFFILFLFLNTVNSQNIYEKSGILSEDETWTRGSGTEGNIYRIVGDVTIPSGITITIEAGVRVHFASLYRILVNGTLRAQGTISDSIFFRNEDSYSHNHGIDFINTSTTSILEYCQVRDGIADSGENFEDVHGGGIFIQNSSPIIKHCSIYNNHATFGGGIFLLFNTRAIIESNNIFNNQANRLGGGIGCNGSEVTNINEPIICNNLIYNNSSMSTSDGGGGISFYNNSSVNLSNNMFFGNSSLGYGGGLLVLNNNTIQILNSIFWSNSAIMGDPQISNRGTGTCVVQYSDVEGAYPGNGNINIYPEFVDVTNFNFQITANSPCIDQGTDCGLLIDFNENPTNQDGNNDGDNQYDIGAFEFLQEVNIFSNSNNSHDYVINTFEDGDNNQIATITLNGIINGSGDISIDCYTKCMPLHSPLGSKAVHRWYRITESGNFSYSTANLTLFYSDIEFEISKLNNENNLTLWHYENGVWINKGGLVNTVQNSVTVSTDFLNGDWAFADVNDCSLPVELKRFEAFLQLDGIKLEWETASEVNNAGFEVWKKILTKGSNKCISSYHENPSLTGMGSSNVGKTYEYLDSEIEIGEVYQYTLTSVNFDGSKENFESMRISTEELDYYNPQSFLTSPNYPNPFNPVTNFDVVCQVSTDIILDIFNNIGEKIDQIYVSNVKGIKTITWNAEGLATGIYFYRIRLMPNDFLLNRRIVKEGKMLLFK